MPVGTSLELVSRAGADGPIDVVAGPPAMLVVEVPEQLIGFYQLRGERIALHSELSLRELNALVRRDLGLAPETG